MPKIFNDYRDFIKGDLVKLSSKHFHKFGADRRLSSLGIVTGHTGIGWIKIAWSNGIIGSWPYYKIAKVLTND